MNPYNQLVNILLVITFLILAFVHISVAADEWQARGDGVKILSDDDQLIYRLERGYLDGVSKNFKNGIIEFELNVSHERAFFYVYFRKQSAAESEVVYIRTHKSDAPDTLQYSPVYQGRSAWQLYHGDRGTAPATLPLNEWVKVKLHVVGNQLSIWMGDNAEANIKDMALTGIDKPGSISFRGFIPRGSKVEHSGMIRNINIQRAADSEPELQTRLTLDEGVVAQYKVSPAFEVENKVSPQIPQNILDQEWNSLAVNSYGELELLKHRIIPRGARSWAVAADATLIAQESTQCQMDLGFSDAITLILNRKPVIVLDASYRYSDRRQQGLMHAQQASVFLDLKAGANTVQAIVADSFGGWGLQARLVNCQGVRTTL